MTGHRGTQVVDAFSGRPGDRPADEERRDLRVGEDRPVFRPAQPHGLDAQARAAKEKPPQVLAWFLLGQPAR
jgi:hypothetical protein